MPNGRYTTLYSPDFSAYHRANYGSNGHAFSAAHRCAAHRHHPTTTDGNTGTGLGLTICKSIVDRYGGRIDVTSEPGHGACFKTPMRATQ